MRFKKTKFEGLFLVEVDQFDDERGYLSKFYDKNFLSEKNIDFNLTQVKYTFTKTKGTIRGLHMQSKPFEEAKIVKCTRGRIYEVVIDLRKKSNTFSKWYGSEFSSTDEKSLFVPKGFAHGYQALTNDCEVLYLMSGEFSKINNIGFRWDDPFFSVKWPLNPSVIADKDRKWPLFKK